MLRVMVCGARTEAEVEMLVRAGVHAIGLITEVWQPLACNLTREEARQLCRRVPPFVETVLVLTEERPEEICRLVERVRPAAVQLHGFNPPEAVAFLRERLPVRIVKTLHLDGDRLVGPGGPPEAREETLAREYLEAGADALLVDRFHRGKVGATGRRVDLGVARRLREYIRPKPLILAGGLHAANLVRAVRTVRPFAVDVFSGAATNGRLNPRKVRALVEAARRAGAADVPYS
ncbi:MAG: phosphoribosylanthranilate isomerase [Moorellales bacterium]